MRTAVWILALLACFAVACDDDPVSNQPTTTRREVIASDQEVGEAALWLSGELTSPPELYDTIHDDVIAIRAEYGASVPKLSIGFRTPWVPSMVIVAVTEEVKQQILGGDTAALDFINQQMNAIEMDTSKLDRPGLGWILIRFDGRKHPRRLAEAYGAVDGVTWAQPNVYFGDWSQWYPWRIPGGMSYLFRDAWGDCPAGCMYSNFYYFKRVNGQTEYVGRYERYVDAEPAWWAEAKTAYETHRQGLDPPPLN